MASSVNLHLRLNHPVVAGDTAATDGDTDFDHAILVGVTPRGFDVDECDGTIVPIQIVCHPLDETTNPRAHEMRNAGIVASCWETAARVYRSAHLLGGRGCRLCRRAGRNHTHPAWNGRPAWSSSCGR